LTVVVAAAESFAAYMAGGRVLVREIFWALYFIVAWRLAWAVWVRTVGRLGEPRRRWVRRIRRRKTAAPSQRRWVAAAACIAPARIFLTIFLFVPLVIGSLVHRFKIGNSPDIRTHSALPLEDVSFVTEDGLKLSGWFLREPSSNITVVICHGAGANKGNFVDFMRVFEGSGYNSLIFDFRGHGESQGHTSTFGLLEVRDVKAAVDWLKRTRPTEAQQVFGLGSSMGAMALVRAAARDPRIEAVVLDSCFAGAPQLAQAHTRRIPVLGRAFAEIALVSLSLHAGHSLWQLQAGPAVAALAPRPVLLIHGEQDTLIPIEQFQMLCQQAREPKSEWLGPGPHSNIMTTDFYEYRRRVISLLEAARR
jgi:alpha-beta hydrolase superfamily lysophospholipase